MRSSYGERSSHPLAVDVEARRDVVNPVLLNCLDNFYGHALLKLFSAQRLMDESPELDLILLIPSWLRWLVPDGVAEIWSVDVPLRKSHQWNDHFAEWIERQLSRWPSTLLAPATPHPSPRDVDIARFTRVSPFSIEHDWTEVPETPFITYVWRDDRSWLRWPGFLDDHAAGFEHYMGRLKLRGILRYIQRWQVTRCFRAIRRRFPGANFAVVGVSAPGGLPEWIDDLRAARPDKEVEVQWCIRFAKSHIVLGIHGSNMLLPSAHAAVAIDLMPAERWGNMTQDFMPQHSSERDALCRYLMLPNTTPAGQVARIAVRVLGHNHALRRSYSA